MYDFKSLHVGKDLYRAKEHEEDITITNEITKATFPVSLKAYGDGPLQLSTDKNFQMFPKLQAIGTLIENKADIARIWADPAFSEFSTMNVLPLIYDEKNNGVTSLSSIRKLPRLMWPAWLTRKQDVGECILFSDFTMRRELTFVKSAMEVGPPMLCNAAYGHIPRTV
jgi:hypothetical protein